MTQETKTIDAERIRKAVEEILLVAGTDPTGGGGVIQQCVKLGAGPKYCLQGKHAKSARCQECCNDSAQL